MNDDTNMNGNELVAENRLDQTARRALVVLGGVLALTVAVIVYGTASDSSWLLWLISLAVIIAALAAVFVFDLTRTKNVAWRSLGQQYGEAFRELPNRDSLAAGRGQLGDNWYFGIRCFASPEGLEINRIMSFVNPPLSIPWSDIVKIDTFPNLLTGRQGFETDMQAQIGLRDRTSLTVEVPWLNDFRTFLPKSVRYRAIKLSKK